MMQKTFIPNNLRKFRRIMGFSQDEVKRKLKLSSKSIVSLWENGETMPSSENLIKLSKLYKTLVNELYYQLGKEYEKELFPEEFEKKPIPKKKDTGRVDRGP